jgi:capsular polysaccharide biosynthesis protein
MDAKEIIVGIHRHMSLGMSQITKLDIGSSDAYINYHRGHYTKEQIEAVYDLEPRFYLLEDLVINGGGSEKNTLLDFSDDIPILFSHCNNNYLHFLFEDISRILFLKEKGVEFKPILGVPLSSKSGQSYLDLYKFLDNPFTKIGLNFEDVLVPYMDYKHIKFSKLITTNIEYLVHFEGYSIASRLLRKYFREQGEPKDNIYISRRYAVNNPRFIHDEEKVEQYYSELGYKIVYNERLNFTEQIELYKNAKHIVGISGTGLVNILFAPDSCKLTELRTSDYRDDEVFRYICKYLNNDYELITSYNSNGSADVVLNSVKSTPDRI